MKEEIKINGVTYPLRWTLLSQQLIFGVKFDDLGNYAKAAIIGTAAIRGANWQSTMTPDKLLNEIGSDIPKLAELANKCDKLLKDFLSFNAELLPSEGNQEAPTESGANC